MLDSVISCKRLAVWVLHPASQDNLRSVLNACFIVVANEGKGGIFNG